MSVKRTEKNWRLFERRWFVRLNGRRINFQTEYAVVSPADSVTWYVIDAQIGFLPLIVDYEGKTDLRGVSLDFLKRYKDWKPSAREYSQDELSRGFL